MSIHTDYTLDGLDARGALDFTEVRLTVATATPQGAGREPSPD